MVSVIVGTDKLWRQTGNVQISKESAANSEIQNFQKTFWLHFTVFLLIVFQQKKTNKNIVKYCQKVFWKVHFCHIFPVHQISGRELGINHQILEVGINHLGRTIVGTSKMQVWNWKSGNFLNHFNKDFLSNKEGFFLEFSLFIWKEILIKMFQEIFGFPVSDLHFWRP